MTEAEREVAAQAAPREVGLVDVDRVEEPEQGVFEEPERVVPHRLVAVAAPRQVGHEHASSLGEERHEVFVLLEARAVAVDQQDRLVVLVASRRDVDVAKTHAMHGHVALSK